MHSAATEIMVTRLLIFTIICLVFCGPSQAKEKESLIEFYLRCIQTPNSFSDPLIQYDSCACLTENMMAFHEKSERERQQRAGRYILDPPRYGDTPRPYILMTEIYAPCLYISARQTVYEDCLYDRTYNHILPSRTNLTGACQCMANETSDYFKKYAPTRLGFLFFTDQIRSNPLETLLNDFDYQIEFNGIRNRCLNQFSP